MSHISVWHFPSTLTFKEKHPQRIGHTDFYMTDKVCVCDHMSVVNSFFYFPQIFLHLLPPLQRRPNPTTRATQTSTASLLHQSSWRPAQAARSTPPFPRRAKTTERRMTRTGSCWRSYRCTGGSKKSWIPPFRNSCSWKWWDSQFRPIIPSWVTEALFQTLMSFLLST